MIHLIGGRSVLPSQVADLFTGKDKTAEDAPRLAVALNPTPIEDAATPVPEAPPPPLTPTQATTPEPTAAELFRQGRAKVEAGDRSGVEAVRRAANQGSTAAQSYLGGLYKTGRAGVPRDLTQARRWFERAAAGGDRTAMHETAMMNYNGEGGPVNRTAAAQWFRRAADLGSNDSRYNLGLLYEQGVGVGKNPAEAYKWFLLAAQDPNPEKRAEAREAAERVRGQISPDAQAQAERAAGAYVGQPANASAPPSATVAVIDIADAQRALARLGFYRGQADGMSSTDLRNAIRAFQRDQGLATTGDLDAATAAKLASVQR
jgi:localization factor PodJL